MLDNTESFLENFRSNYYLKTISREKVFNLCILINISSLRQIKATTIRHFFQLKKIKVIYFWGENKVERGVFFSKYTRLSMYVPTLQFEKQKMAIKTSAKTKPMYIEVGP
jgi:hypothetical protein